MNVNGQTLTYCTTLSAQVSSHCPSLAANCDEARHLISLCLSIELLGRLVNKARHKSNERRINVTSTSFVVLGTCLQQHSITCSWSPKSHWGMSNSLCTCSPHLPSAKASWGLFLLPVHRDNLVVKASNGFQWHEKLHRLLVTAPFPLLSNYFFLFVHVQLTSKVRVNGACRTRDNKCKSATRWSRTCVEGVDGNVAQARS